MFQFWRFTPEPPDPREVEQLEKLKLGHEAIRSTISPTEVLLVEDDEMVAEFMTDLLHSFGCEVEWMPSAEAALDRLDNGKLPSLILSDIRMPGKSGAVMAAEIARKWPDLKVVLMTGFADAFDGMSENQKASVLKKPIDCQELYHALMSDRVGMPSKY